MNKFNPGDKVRCISVPHATCPFEVGKIYMVDKMHSDDYVFIDHKYADEPYKVDRFEPVEDKDPPEDFQKFDDAKPRYDLIPPMILDDVAKVLTYGAQKYDDENWHKCTSQRRYFSAAMRHLWAWARGETDDPETGLSHIAHAICCLLFMGELDTINPETDDRADIYKGEE